MVRLAHWKLTRHSASFRLFPFFPYFPWFAPGPRAHAYLSTSLALFPISFHPCDRSFPRVKDDRRRDRILLYFSPLSFSLSLSPPLSLPFPPFPSPSDHVRPLDFSAAARILPRLWRKNKGIEIGLRPNRIQPGLTNREATRIERRPNRIGLG